MEILDKLRCLLALAMMAILLTVGSMSLNKLTSKKVSRIISTVRDDSPPPAVLLCLSNKTNYGKPFPEQLEAYTELEKGLFPEIKLLHSEAMDRTDVIPLKPLIEKHYRLYGAEKYPWMYVCFTIKVSLITLGHADQLVIFLKRDSLADIEVRLHVADVGNTLFSRLDLLGRAHKSLPMLAENRLRLAYDKKILLVKRLPNQPCNNENQQDFQACVDDFIARHIPCILPWLPKQLPGDNRHVCESEADYLAVSRAGGDIPTMTLLDIVNKTGCSYNCKFGSYELEELDRHPNPAYFNTTHITLVPNSKNVIMETEELTYSIQDCIADLGGFLGLLLGASVLTVFDKLVAVLRALNIRMKYVRAKRKSTGQQASDKTFCESL